MSGDPIAFMAARLDEDERYLNSNRRHLWTERPLREVEAKRAILAEHAPSEIAPDTCRTCKGMAYPCRTVRHLVIVWSDHDRYRAEWKP